MNAAYLYIGAVVDELARSGVGHVCLCPGSRSTPLAISFARDPRFRVWVHLDERSAVFFALGLARATGMSAAIVCTSGTAVANFMPAVVEARHARVPLLLITADRPPEARDRGAAQTIDQIRFFGPQVKWSVEMATPMATDEMLRYARATACGAVARALEAPAGPVHLNVPLREPLIPIKAPEEISASLSPLARYGRPDGQPFVQVTPSVPMVDAATISTLAVDLAACPRGLIVVGPLDEPALADPLTALAHRLGYPILADPLSGFRRGPHTQRLIIDSYDAFLRDPRFAAQMVPEVVLRFGAMPTAKPLLQYLQRHPQARQIVVARREALDPTLLAGWLIEAEPSALCQGMLACLAPEVARLPAASHDPWLAIWLAVAVAVRDALKATVAAMDEPFEGRIFTELATLLPAGANLIVGNSMPIRDLDTFFPKHPSPIRLFGNRGAAGIDGLISTALGVAASGAHPSVLVLGDLSFYHDMNGLLAAQRHGLSLVVVVVQNDGGGIFSFLPQAEAGAVATDWSFEALFGTPHGLDFRHAAALYGAAYTRPGSWTAFRQAVSAGIERGGLHIVEVVTDRARNVELHRRCWPAVSAAIAGILDRMA